MAVEKSAAELDKFIRDSNRASIEASQYRDKYLGDSGRQTQTQQRLAAIKEETEAFKKAVAGIATDSQEYEQIYAAHKTKLLNIDKQFEEKKNQAA
ncbi:hypothetical protein [Neopusillimonas aromaticivorans]|uniref:hypothetical protein n=1 Tax=Neopusillimonas aromaticivorans TaxID=2979868 RepID=UPI00259616E8|nr:hypothetical protein [Neopusillimonas aromaticivorans]WJJ93992.1 hypothetical protein N7E01_02095 [Neopusillimonas aromaticivorans]